MNNYPCYFLDLSYSVLPAVGIGDYLFFIWLTMIVYSVSKNIVFELCFLLGTTSINFFVCYICFFSTNIF
jgi:hypothetical protein